ncbi:MULTISPECIES: response regulator [Comamonas]|uniref:response regulator n=1 Tax=Comamonas TaxID=283 RepID=UPI0006365C1D|nr:MULTISPECIES: response regulator transcription factor [Comamonas]UUE94347.1 response regulator transcription factor [Comamonas thiooxydans]GAO70558.1 LuxR family transcriptional regulator [Comamonas sp. E6]
MDPNGANNSGDALMLRPMAVELGSPSMWPDHMVGQPDKPVRVLLVDDDAHLRMVIAQEIMNDRRTMVVAQADNLKDARKAIRQHEFDVMLLDLKLGADDGLELIEVMKSHRPQAEVIVVSVVETEEQVLHAFELGATGYLVKNSWFGNYPQAVLQVVNGGASITPSLARRLLQRYDKRPATGAVPGAGMSDRLSSRECEVLRMVASGNTSAEIGVQLEISTMTVNTHIKNIYRKLQVRTRAQAVRFAYLRGWF